MVKRLASAILLLGLAAWPAAPRAQDAAQEPQQPSYQGTLRRECPAKNLDFLPDDQTARSISDFIERLPEAKREDVVEAGRADVAACAHDGACTTRAAIAALRTMGLAADLARSVCALPLRCTDVGDCGPDTAAARPRSAANDAPPPLAEEPPPPLAEEPPPRVAENPPLPAPVPEPPAAPVRGGSDLPSTPPRPETPREAALGFYQALARGDGIGAEWYVVREKRGSGPFVAARIERFYGTLPEPLTVLSAEETGPATVSVRYRFTARGGAVCEGRSTVTVRETSQGYRIARIIAPSGC
jgi:hypothetical protein